MAIDEKKELFREAEAVLAAVERLCSRPLPPETVAFLRSRGLSIEGGQHRVIHIYTSGMEHNPNPTMVSDAPGRLPGSVFAWEIGEGVMPGIRLSPWFEDEAPMGSKATGNFIPLGDLFRKHGGVNLPRVESSIDYADRRRSRLEGDTGVEG